MSIRDSVAAAVTNLMPAGAKLIPFQRNVDTLDRVTLMLKLAKIEYAQGAPLGAWTVSYVLTVIHPATDPEISDPGLDDIVLDLFEGLQSSKNLWPTEAEKVSWDASHIAYDITLKQNTKKAS